MKVRKGNRVLVINNALAPRYIHDLGYEIVEENQHENVPAHDNDNNQDVE